MAPKDENSESRFNCKDVYTRVTDRIISMGLKILSLATDVPVRVRPRALF